MTVLSDSKVVKDGQYVRAHRVVTGHVGDDTVQVRLFIRFDQNHPSQSEITASVWGGVSVGWVKVNTYANHDFPTPPSAYTRDDTKNEHAVEAMYAQMLEDALTILKPRRLTGTKPVTATTATSGYFIDKARAAFKAAGGDPDNAGPLAAWAQQAKQEGRTRAGVIVAADGTLLAETFRSDGPVEAFYVNPADTIRLSLTGANAISLAMSTLRRETGQNVIHVPVSNVVNGSGAAAARNA